MKRITVSQLTGMVEANPDAALYVRYSRGPAADAKSGYLSHNHQTGETLEGLSVNELAVPHWWPVNGRTVRGWLEVQIRDYSYMLHQGGRGTRAWVLRGREIGRGSDNEPLITDVEPVAWLAQ